MKKGKVFLVGAGPGDAGLITVKGMELIKQAEVILYDRLANPKLLEFAPRECEFIYCGKLPDRHILRQEAINRLLVEKALEGKFVVRLKGGDPGVFGRVGEEAAALSEYQIPFEIVPGISSGVAAPLYAGIPVTHREYGESFAVVTAHDKSPDGKPKLDWKGLAAGIDTIAFYMGIANLPYICENLMKHGKSPVTPVILIQWGTYGRQKTLQGALADIAEKAKTEKFSNPAITLVGDIISIRNKINWFEKKPLFGRQILLARTGISESGIAKELANEGADVIEFPKWKKSSVPVDPAAVEKLPLYQKILFASPESVNEFFDLLIEQGIDLRRIKADLYARSAKSLEILKKRGVAARLADEMKETGSLLIVGDRHHEKNKHLFSSKYGSCDFLATSEKRLDEQFGPIFLRMIEEASLDTMIFLSAASVGLFMEGIEALGLAADKFLENLKVVCLGKQTAAAAEVFGVKDYSIPKEPEKSALIHCIKEIQNQ